METRPAIQPQRAAWSPETIGRFWDYWSRREDRDSWYFTASFAPALAHLANLAGVLRGEVLDYGFGRGFLIDELLRHPVSLHGLEFSSAATALAEQRFAGRPGWRGAIAADALPTPLAAEAFDLTFCIEVFEHLDDELFEGTAAELARITRPSGYVIVTTPCRENLAAEHIYCPFCNSEFHHVQHLRSIAPEQLAGLLERHGFEVLLCRGIDLGKFLRILEPPKLLHLSYARARVLLGYRRRLLLDRLLPTRKLGGRALAALVEGKGAHLCALARKR